MKLDEIYYFPIVWGVCLVVLVCSLYATIAQGADKVPPPPESKTPTVSSIDAPPITPKFFLLLRFWTNKQNNAPEWTYSPEFFNTQEEALARLNSGRGFNGLESVEVVGLWDLNNCKVSLDVKESDRVIPVRVEEQKYKVRTWYVKSGK